MQEGVIIMQTSMNHHLRGVVVSHDKLSLSLGGGVPYSQLGALNERRDRRAAATEMCAWWAPLTTWRVTLPLFPSPHYFAQSDLWLGRRKYINKKINRNQALVSRL